MSGAGIRTLMVWCPDWPVVAAEIVDGVVAAGPVVVLSGNRVLACSEAARADGVRRGLRRREAQSRCPQLTVVEHDPGRDARAFEPVVAAVEEVAVGVEVIRPGACALAARGPARYFGGEEEAAERIVEQVAQACAVESQVGIADGVFAAGLAARSGQVVGSGRTREFLSEVSVEALDRPELSDLLRRLGIKTLGDFAALPASDVLTRFGFDGALAHRLAAGYDHRPLAVRQPPPDLDVSDTYDEPLERVDVAAFAGRALAERLHERLAGHGLACTRLGIEAVTADGQELHRVWRHDGTLTAAAIAERVRWQLDGWLTGARRGTAVRPTAGLVRLRLVPDGVLVHLGLQPGLWGDTGAERERAHRALSRVQGLLGPDAVVTPVIDGGRSADDQARLVPWGDERTPDRPAARQVEPIPGSTTTAVVSDVPAAATPHLTLLPPPPPGEPSPPIQIPPPLRLVPPVSEETQTPAPVRTLTSVPPATSLRILPDREAANSSRGTKGQAATEAGAGAEAGATAEAESGVEAVSGPRAGAGSGVRAGAGARARAAVEAGPGALRGVGAGSGVGAGVEVGPGAGARAEVGAGSDVGAGSRVGAGSGVEAGMEAGRGDEVEAGPGAEAGSRAVTGPGAGAGPGAEAGRRARAGAEGEAWSKVQGEAQGEQQIRTASATTARAITAEAAAVMTRAKGPAAAGGLVAAGGLAAEEPAVEGRPAAEGGPAVKGGTVAEEAVREGQGDKANAQSEEPGKLARAYSPSDASPKAAGPRRRTGRRPPVLPPWPGRLPKPPPALVLEQPLDAVVLDAGGASVGVSARLELSGEPATLLIERGAPVEIIGWAGPWPAEERWWAPAEARRRARFQLIVADGRAFLLSLASGHWAVEAIYD